MNRLALGTVQFGLPYGVSNHSGQVSIDEARSIVRLAMANEINTLDTAIAYGNSEARLGEIGVKDWQIVSKLPEFPKIPGNLSKWIHESVENSLDRLRVDSIYALLLHRPLQLLEDGGVDAYRTLKSLKESGSVQKIGISIYGPDELDLICHRYRFDLIQAPLNIFDRRLIHTGWLDRLSKEGIEIHARSAFLQGLLLMPSKSRPEKFRRWSEHWKRWDAWLEETGLTPLEACLRYVLSFQKVRRVIIGTETVSQLQQILRAATGSVENVPDTLSMDDVNLVNPANWNSLD